MFTVTTGGDVSVPYRGATFLNEKFDINKFLDARVSVPYRGATFLNAQKGNLKREEFFEFPSPIGELHFSIAWNSSENVSVICFRPLSGSYISQYHPRNPMSCLGRIGGLRGKSNFIEIQLFWKVKSSHKSSI